MVSYWNDNHHDRSYKTQVTRMYFYKNEEACETGSYISEGIPEENIAETSAAQSFDELDNTWMAIHDSKEIMRPDVET